MPLSKLPESAVQKNGDYETGEQVWVEDGGESPD